MDFSFTEEQQLLEDTVLRFVAKDYAFEKRHAIRASAGGWSREAWQALADLGLLALNVPEEHGGLGAGPVDTMLALNALGPGLLQEPYLASAVVATALLRECPQQAGLLAQMAAGERIAVLAHDEPGARGNPCHVATLCRPDGTDFLLDGRKCVVAHAAAADFLIVSARLGDDLALFLVPCDAAGLTLDAYPTLDGTRAAEVHLNGVRLPAGALLPAGADVLRAQAGVWERLKEALARRGAVNPEEFFENPASYAGLASQIALETAEREAQRIERVAARLSGGGSGARARRRRPRPISARPRTITGATSRFSSRAPSPFNPYRIAVQLHTDLRQTLEVFWLPSLAVSA